MPFILLLSCPIRCGVCGVDLNSPNIALQHYSSSRHARQLRKLNEGGVVEKIKEKGESVTSSKEVLPILSSMAVDKCSRKARRGRRDGIALQDESLTGKEKEGEEMDPTGDAHTVQSFETHRLPLSSLIEDEEGSLSRFNKFKQFSVKESSASADSRDVETPVGTSAQLSRSRLIVMDSGKRPLPAPSSMHSLSEQELAAIFKEHNPILVKLIETGSRKRQLGYVDFASVGDAAAAREALHMTKHGDFTLKLKWEKEQSSFSSTYNAANNGEMRPSTNVDTPDLHVRQVVDK